jgi:Tfp pilus assembly protein PilF
MTPQQVADVQVAYGRTLEKQGLVPQAMKAYSDALKHDQTRADACVRLAVLSDREGKFSESLPLYRRALKLQPANPDLYCNMGYSLYLQHHWNEAEMNLRQAIALAPDHQRSHVNLGLVLSHTGRAEEAMVEFSQGGCTVADAHSNIAFAMTLERHYAQAREHYLAALAENSHSDSARTGLKELEVLLARVAPRGAPLLPACTRSSDEVTTLNGAELPLLPSPPQDAAAAEAQAADPQTPSQPAPDVAARPAPSLFLQRASYVASVSESTPPPALPGTEDAITLPGLIPAESGDGTSVITLPSITPDSGAP